MSLAKDFTIVGSATLASRLTGFVRDVMIAAVLGSGAVADAYIAAFLLPNLFRRVISEGAFNASFVPIFARRKAEGGLESAERFAEAALSSFVALVLALLLAAELFMPSVISAIAPGFVDTPEKFANAVLFGRVAFLFVAFILVVALLSSVLNAINRFALVALAPVILNVMLIAALAGLLLLGMRGNQTSGLVLVTTVAAAGLVQLTYVWRAVRRSDMPLKLGWPKPDPDVRRLVILALPGLAIAGSGHLNMLVAAQLSSALPSAVSWLYYADRIFQLPLSFVAASIGVVLLPEVARALRAGDPVSAAASSLRALEFGLMLAIPAALSLVILAGPIIGIIYEHGAFVVTDTAATSKVLRALALGLPGFVLVKVFLPAYLARETMRVPIFAALAGIAVNIVVTLALMETRAHAAAPLGVAASAWTNAGILFIGLLVGGHFRLDLAAMRRLPVIVLAGCVTGTAIYALCTMFGGWLEAPTPFALRALALGLLCCIGVACQLALLWLVRAADPADLKGMLRRSGP